MDIPTLKFFILRIIYIDRDRWENGVQSSNHIG